MDSTAYKKLLLQLQPQGLSWNKDEGSNLNNLAAGEAVEFTRLEEFAYYVLRQLNPLTSTDLIEEWAKIALRDDDCINNLTTIAEKKAAVLAKLVSLGGSDKLYFQNVAKAAGFLVSVSDGFEQFRAADSRTGDRVLADGFAFTWSVRSPTTTLRYFRAAEGRVGDPLVYFGNALLECILKDIKPAHTTIIFSYLDVIKELAGNSNIGVTMSGAMSIVRELSASASIGVVGELADSWTPTQLNDLLLWFDGDEFTSDAAVTTWTDKQGNRDAVQNTGANKPDSVTDVLNGHSVVRFGTGDSLEVRTLNQLDANNGLHFFAVCDLTAGGGLLFDRHQLFLRADTSEVQSEVLTQSYRSNLHFSDPIPYEAAFGSSDGINSIALYENTIYATGEWGLWKLESDNTWTDVSGGFGASDAPRGQLLEYNSKLYAISGTVNKMYVWDGTTFSEYTNTVDGSASLVAMVFNPGDNKFYIADQSNGKLLSFDPATNTWASVGTGVGNCNSVACDGTNVYINRRDGTGDIYKWNGTTFTSESLSGILNPTALSWIEGTLWVFDTTTGKLTNKANSYTLTDVPSYQYLLPKTIKKVGDELWLVSDSTYFDRIARYTLDGTNLDDEGWAGDIELQSPAGAINRVRDMLFIPGSDDLELYVNVGKTVQRVERKRYVTETDTFPAKSIVYFGIEDGNMQISVNGELVQNVSFDTETYRNPNVLLEQIAITNGSLVTFLDDLVTINPASDLPDNSVIEVQVDSGAITDWDGISDWTFET